MHRLLDVSRKSSRLVVGLMSGTSHDGVDAALARISGSGEGAGVEFVSHSFRPYPAGLRQRVRRAFEGSTTEVCALNFELGEFFGKAAIRAVRRAGMDPANVDLIGSHGQTIHHHPPGRGGRGCTLQVGEGSVIAMVTGALTVTDFRTADMAAGGQGAPLVPYADWVLFRRPGEVMALQNIGGIANVTVVTERPGDVFGFDTGPGNSLIDEAARIISGGKLSLDKGGKLAKSGELDGKLLKKLLRHPFFRKKPPKSTGREEFGRAFVQGLVDENPGVPGRDMLCTLTHLTAASIHEAYERFVYPRVRPNRVVVTGGGAANRFLMKLLRGLFRELPVEGPETLGVPSQAMEALCFAVLANETVMGKPGSLPAVTGARYPAVLGKISM